MYITKLLIRDFGKFHNVRMDLTPGINIVVGEENSGKSTLRDFLIGLIYGIPRREGITKVRSNYEVRKPSGRSGYSGTAYIKEDDKSYLVERNFLAGAKKASVLDVQSGRDVRLNNADTLCGTLCNTDKNTFLDTKCIVEDEDSIRDLHKYLTNITLTGSSAINKSEAIKYLENERKSHIPRPLIRRLDELDEKLAEYETVDDEIEVVEDEIKRINEEFILEAEKRKREARKLVENEDGSVTYESDDELDSKIDRITEKESNYGASEIGLEDDKKERKKKLKEQKKKEKEEKKKRKKAEKETDDTEEEKKEDNGEASDSEEAKNSESDSSEKESDSKDVSEQTDSDKEDMVDRSDFVDEEDKEDKIPITDRLPVIFLSGAMVILIITLVVYSLPFEPTVRFLFVVFTAAFVVYTIVEGLRIKGMFKSLNLGSSAELPDEDEFQKVLQELEEEAKEQEELEIDMSFAKDYQEQKEILNEMLEKLLVKRGERNQMRQEFDQVFKRKSELEDEMKAIDFAINKINALSNQYRKDAFKSLLGNVSTFIGSLTLGKYRELGFDETGSIILKGNSGIVPLDELTDQEAGKVYLAVRLSISKFLAKENMPLIIDGTRCLSSVEEVKALVDSLVSMKEEQIIVMTEDTGMESIFRSKGIEVNLVNL